MSAHVDGVRRRWLASAAGALVILTVLLVALRVPYVPVPPQQIVKKPMPVRFDPGDPVMSEDADMHDQRPLFLPTERNAGPRPLPVRQAGASLLNQDALRMFFGEADLALRLPPPIVIPETPVGAILSDARPAPLHGIGRREAVVEPLPSRGATVEIFASRTNQRVLTQQLPVSARPPVEKGWRPMEFLAVVNPAGLVGPLVINERSDVEEAEVFFRIYLTRSFRLGDRLTPGIYRVVVAP